MIFSFNDPLTGELHQIEHERALELEVPERHLYVSMIPTPTEFIETLGKNEYVRCYYMREVADFFYPGWSFNILSNEYTVDPDGNPWKEIHGRLKWIEGHDERSIDVLDAHRVQYLKGTKTFSDYGDDIKSAGTDCLKKLFSLGMNISDDIYRWTGSMLLPEQKKSLEDLVAELTKDKVLDETTSSAIASGIRRLNRGNYMEIKTLIKRICDASKTR